MDTRIKVGMASLGCPKNQMDAEIMLARIEEAGYELTAEPGLADVVVVNTCGFIESAKQEAIDEILEYARLKEEGRIRKIVVTGCLAERYRDELRRELPECDAVLGLGANGDIVKTIREVLDDGVVERFPDKSSWPLNGPRVRTTPHFFAYLRVADGCDNRCAYCAIPLIRGPLRSRPMNELLVEAAALAADGVRELILVAQDTTRYGADTEGRLLLPELLEALCAIEGLHWIRLLYCYPEHVSDRLLDVMAAQPKIVKYMDLPVQHADGRILKAMNRQGDAASLLALVRRIRGKVPGITLRTTVMTGFPGEDEAAFDTLCRFVRDAKFERLGCFAFSPEEGTPAADLPDQVDKDEAERRRDIVMEEQYAVMAAHNEAQVGRTVEVLVESADRYASGEDTGTLWFGRRAADAPDIDCKVFFTVPSGGAAVRNGPIVSAPSGGVKPGDFVDITVTDVLDWDLLGEPAGAAGTEGTVAR